MTTGPAEHAAEGGTPGVAGRSADGRPTVLVARSQDDIPLPTYALPGDAGADIVTATDLVLAPGQRAVVPTGLSIALPDGHAAFVHPRSGLAARAGLALVNAPGTIDSGYRGEVKVIVINHDPTESLHLSRGERIAQLVVQRVEHARFVEVDTLPTSERGAGGHGSTGGADALARPLTTTSDPRPHTASVGAEPHASHGGPQ